MVSLVTLLTIGLCIVVVICVVTLGFMYFTRLEEMYQVDSPEEQDAIRAKYRTRIWGVLILIALCVGIVVLT